jgi:hypothetical protein
VSGQTNNLVAQLSERLAMHSPKLTLDFLSEVALTMGKTSVQQRLHCLKYMCPWIKNLTHFTEPTSPHYDHSSARLRDCIRALIELTLADKEVGSLRMTSIDAAYTVYRFIPRCKAYGWKSAGWISLSLTSSSMS